MASSQIDLFSGAFWRTTFNNVIHGAAAGALATAGIGGVGNVDPDLHISLPGWTIVGGALSGAFMSLLLSIAGQTLPQTGVASMVPDPPEPVKAAKPRKRTPRPPHIAE